MNLTIGSKADCRVTRYERPDEKSAILSDFCMVMVPMKAGEIGLLSWEEIEGLLITRAKEIGIEMRASSVPEAILFGGEVSRQMAAKGRMLLVEGLALLSFSPCGVKFAGYQYVSQHEDAPYRQPRYEDNDGLRDR